MSKAIPRRERRLIEDLRQLVISNPTQFVFAALGNEAARLCGVRIRELSARERRKAVQKNGGRR